jgi:hypothetical protein
LEERVVAIEISRPADMALPPKAEQVLGLLTPERGRVFIQELLASMQTSQAQNDLRPMLNVVEAWYRTQVLQSDPDYQVSVKRARRLQRPVHGQTVEELRQQLA